MNLTEVRKVKYEQRIQYGTHSGVDLTFVKSVVGPDTQVLLEGQELCWISFEEKDQFVDDFQEFLRKYYI